MKIAIPTIETTRVAYEASLVKLCDLLKSQMELLDDLCLGSNSVSFLKRMVTSLRQLDVGHVKARLQQCNLNAILMSLIKAGEIDVKGSIDAPDGALVYSPECHIFSRRGAPKLNVDKRRISFASTKFYDGDVLLTVGSLHKMSDLDYLFSLNGYHLPFCESTNQRSMYESFFGSFLKKLEEFDPPGLPSVAGRLEFRALQEIICSIYIITELCVDALECIVEIITVISTRVKAFNSSSQLKSSSSSSNSPRSIGSPRSSPVQRSKSKPDLQDQDDILQPARNEVTLAQNEVLTHLMAVMSDSDKVFSLFKCRKLLKSVNARGVETEWLLKVDNYAQALEEANELYMMNCDAFLKSAKEMASKSDGHVRGIANDLTIYISEFRMFVIALRSEGGAYKTMLKAGRELLKCLDDLETQSPLKYGGISSPRGKQGKAERQDLNKSGGSLWLAALSPRNYFRK